VQHIFQLLCIQGLHVTPEPLNDLVSRLVPCVIDVAFEISSINIFLAIDDHVELMRLKDREQVGRDDLVDPIPDVFNHFEHTACAIMLASSLSHTYTRLTYSSLLVEFTMMWKPFYLRGMVIWVPCSSNS
jgi:hypothetical protein